MVFDFMIFLQTFFKFSFVSDNCFYIVAFKGWIISEVIFNLDNFNFGCFEFGYIQFGYFEFEYFEFGYFEFGYFQYRYFHLDIFNWTFSIGHKKKKINQITVPQLLQLKKKVEIRSEIIPPFNKA